MKETLILKVDKDDFAKLDNDVRGVFDLISCEPDDYEIFKDDPYFISLSTQYRKAKKSLLDYKFEKRNK